jgi:hypothetical protein
MEVAMVSTGSTQLERWLERLAESLDIPDHLHEKAIQKYESVGEWIEEQDASQGRRDPEIYSQGSFRLGTVVRPIGRDDYDVDLVYERDLRKASITQECLKEEAGEHLRAFVDAF